MGRYQQNVCYGRSGVTKLGCPVSNRFVQCSGETCSVETCPSGQVWNFTVNACTQCAPGMHVDTRWRQRCACDKGSRTDRKTRQCVACPSGAVVEEDRCYCPGTLSFNKRNNSCSACPAGSSLAQLFGGCYCLDRKQFWSAEEWTCKSCPGSWVKVPVRGFLGRLFNVGKETCTCTGVNQVFNSKTVTCYTCPSTTIAMEGKCKCKMGGEVFDDTNKTCVCGKGLKRNASGACVLNESEAAPTEPNVINP